MYCKECGKEINDKAVICPNCGCKTKSVLNTEKNKWIALLLWFFLGAFGGHRFYVGDTGGAVGYILCFTLGWFLFCIPPAIAAIFLIVDLVAILQGKLKDVELEG